MHANKKLIRQFGALFSTTALAQLLAYAATPILTRIYPESDFGVFFTYSAVVGTLSILATLQYDMAIVLPHRHEHAADLLKLSLLVSVLSFCVLTCILFIFHDHLPSSLKNLGVWIYFVPLSVFFTSAFQVFSYWQNRFSNYSTMGYGKITKSGIASFSQLSGFFSLFRPWGLLGGQIVGQIGGTVYLWIKSNSQVTHYSPHVRIARIRILMRWYRNIPFFNTGIRVLNTLSNYLPALLLGQYYGLQAVAYYGLAHRILAAPMGLVTESLGQVLYRKASELIQQQKTLNVLVSQTYRKLFAWSIFPFLLLFWLSPDIFSFAFGAEWEYAGTLTRLLIPWLFLMGLNSPLTYIITVLNKQSTVIWYEVFLFASRFLALWLGNWLHHDLWFSILYFSLAGVVCNLWLMAYIRYISKIGSLKILV